MYYSERLVNIFSSIELPTTDEVQQLLKNFDGKELEGDLDLDMGDESSEGGPSTGPRQRQDMNEIGRKAAFLAFGNNADNCPDRKLGKP